MMRGKNKPGGVSCRTAAKRLQAYLDNEIESPLTRTQVEQHLELCRHCGLEADTYRSIQSVLRGHAPTVPEATRQRLASFGQALADADEAAGPDDTPTSG